MLEIITIPALNDNYVYLLHDEASGATAVVDPAEADSVLRELDQRNWRLDYVLNTHHHADHVGGNLHLRQQTGCQIVAGSYDRNRIPGITLAAHAGDTVTLGASQLKISDTPGHTLGHIAYYCADSAALFCGDTLFSLGCGRLFEGTAEQLHQSLQQLAQLPADTRVYCAHEYTQANARFALSVDTDNPALQQRAAEVEALRRRQQATLPTDLASELACNPFLRSASTAIRRQLGFDEQAADVEVFTRLRQMKDRF